MEYISTKELAKRWGVDPSRILRLVREGRIEGAVLFGNNWMFPGDVKKPADRRRRKEDQTKTEVPFRFPFFADRGENDFDPPLSPEEKTLRRAQLLFHDYRFDEAEKLLIPLAAGAANRYVRIYAMEHRCSIAMYQNRPDFDSLLQDFYFALSGDFPYRKEMLLTRYGLESDMCYYRSLIEDFSVDPAYSYHPSVYHYLNLLSFLPIENGDFTLLSKLRYETYEILCQQMEHDGAFYFAQELHYLLLVVYQLQNNKPKMRFHTRRALEIAWEKSYVFNAAVYHQYYPDITNEELKNFPEDFSHRITSISKKVHKNIVAFAQTRQDPSYLGTLTEGEYKYAFLASQGFTNSEIADKLKVSEKYVSRKFGDIYEKMGIKGKKELLDVISNMHRGELANREES